MNACELLVDYPMSGDTPDYTRRMERLFARFDPISLAEMERVALLDRTDTKYVMGGSQLYAALRQVAGEYRVLCINYSCLNHYQTLYFDTPDFAMYRQHHNGVASRYKVRARKYVDSALAFMEVKHKTNQNRTVKSRLPIPDIMTYLRGAASGLVAANTPFDTADLEPKLWNDYVRITLVSRQRAERLTLDFNLVFSWGDASVVLPGIAIAEVKQDHLSQQSAFIQQMRRLGVRPMALSKYCLGACLLYDHLKINNFKPRLRQVHKIMKEELQA